MDLYVFASIGLFGFLFIVISFFLGEFGHAGDFDAQGVGHDIDVGDHDVAVGDHDADSAHAGHAGDIDAPGPFSMRVLSVFLTVFGTVATAARLSGLHGLTSAALGVAAGYGLGWATWRFMRLVWQQGGSSHVCTSDLVGGEAEVTVALAGGGPGQVSCVVNGARTYQIARTASGMEIPLGSRVRILSVTPEGVLVEPAVEQPAPAPEDLKGRMHHA